MQRWLIGIALAGIALAGIALAPIWFRDLDPASRLDATVPEPEAPQAIPALSTLVREAAALLTRPHTTPADQAPETAILDAGAIDPASIDLGSIDMAPHLELPDLVALMAQEDADVEPVQQIVRVPRGGTLMEVLTDAGIDRADAHEAIAALKPVFDPRRLQPGQEITLTFGPTPPSPTGAGRPDERANERGDFVGLALQASVERDVMVLRGERGRFEPHQLVKPLTKQLAYAAGTIQSSLYEAAVALDVPLPLFSEMVRAYSYDVDFQREIHPGDRFEILFEAFVDDQGRRLRHGDLLFALLTTAGAEQRLYRFTPKGGFADYFNDRGHSVRKALLRTPIDGARLTSGFGSRMHPILGYTVQHRGVDFGAPTGTPIMAAGDGAIAELGWKGGYGQYIRVRHSGEFATAYAHISAYARGLKPGARVRQGQIIGYVGATGLATGPHLHYEVHRNGGQVNPTGVKFPAGQKLNDAELRQFQQVQAQLGRQVASLRDGARLARAGGWPDIVTGAQASTAAGCLGPRRAAC
jgi:murein DD-endopeptidase MepM/ murein hydrolase activator NlpD